ncbi:MAG: hypothetical protein JWO64_2121 [Hyphomicrobiales bacterium]|jgi:hypothetical protein|nr:hypothetical protein [Hyphomicrobiales bacterium]
MSRILAASVILILAWHVGAEAQGRPDTLAMPCATAAGIVKSAGAIVLGTGPNIYDRYVATRAFCQRDEEMVPRWTAARDNPACFVGYVCERKYGDPANR